MNYFHFFIAYCGGAFTMWMLMRPTDYEEYSHEPVKLITRKTETGWTFTEPGFDLEPGQSTKVDAEMLARAEEYWDTVKGKSKGDTA